MKKSAPRPRRSNPYASMLVLSKRVSREPRGKRNIAGVVDADLHAKIVGWCRSRGILVGSFVGASLRMLDDSGLLDELIGENRQPGDVARESFAPTAPVQHEPSTDGSNIKPEDLLTIEEVAELNDCSVSTIYRAIKKGLIKPVMVRKGSKLVRQVPISEAANGVPSAA